MKGDVHLNRDCRKRSSYQLEFPCVGTKAPTGHRSGNILTAGQMSWMGLEPKEEVCAGEILSHPHILVLCKLKPWADLSLHKHGKQTLTVGVIDPIGNPMKAMDPFLLPQPSHNVHTHTFLCTPKPLLRVADTPGSYATLGTFREVPHQL